MARSAWKICYYDRLTLRLQTLDGSFNSQGKGSKVFQIFSRNNTVSEALLNFKISVHNGRAFQRLNLSENHIGFKLGDLVLTKAIGVSIHLYNKVNKKKKESQKLIKQKKRARIKSKKKTAKKVVKKKTK